MIYLQTGLAALAVLGAILFIVSVTYRIARKSRERKAALTRTAIAAPLMPFLLGNAAWIGGLVMTCVGGGGDLVLHALKPPEITLFGTIRTNDSNWAQLDLDQGQNRNGQPIQGFVVLLKDPMSPDPTSPERIKAAYAYFSAKAGLHCTLQGEWVPDGALQYFYVKADDCKGGTR